MYERFQLIAVIAIAVVWGLVALARRRPDIAWLRPFRAAFPRLSEPQRAEARRRSDFVVGIQFILLAIAVPLAVGVFKLMFLTSFSATEVVIVGAISALCLALGIAAISKSRRG